MSYCSGCGRPLGAADHTECRQRQLRTDPPRYCMTCGRKLVVQVLPLGFRARCVRCGELAPGDLPPRNGEPELEPVR